ncbi:3-oxoacyl-[acyl-carrier-protein] synthase 2 [Streptomyces hundungensis]|uniref:3-oxoacyl-[acyl-carrier-protein] synthase 2 n=1 Tax=Streptomyces hundungensis TaxID=1077946 RepID=A0A387HDJ4_9ACTN|nr:beta-ketoacyl synthase N-terminal-like domain-containing protein [Streptomyces hundungensis]AYG80711.1 3-oxoacyl-[acyl-carrier-protein] synthase 2 [Streptomyces hundungensis]
MTGAATLDDPGPTVRPAPAGDLVFSAWSALSPYGAGREAYRAGLAAGANAQAPLDPSHHPGPYQQAALVREFSPAGALGKKGTRTMDRLTALAVAAYGQLLQECGPDVVEHPERLALVLGTGHGSVQSIMDFTRDSLTGERPYLVDPARFPNTVMNRMAGQSAIWHGIKGPNTTVAGGWLTGLLALGYAARLHRGGHCDRVLCGAAEEYSTQRAWLEWHAAAEAERPPLGEGAVVWLLEPAASASAAGRTPLARLLGTRFRAYHRPAAAADALTTCVRAVLDDAGVDAASVRVVAPLGAEGEEDAVLRALPEGADPRLIRCRPLLGDASAAATAFQTGAVLALAEEGGLPPGATALVTGIDRDGTVGCALLGG